MVTTAVVDTESIFEAVVGLHPYETPEVIALPIVEGSARYLEWISSSTTAP